MNIVVLYVLPLCAGERYFDYALRFLESYHTFPPMADHQTVVVTNGGKPDSNIRCLFGTLPHCTIIHHDNSGFDIGAYQIGAQSIPCDLMLFLGTSTYFKRAGWMRRIEESYNRHGNALYGVMGNMGDKRVNVFPHIRTTGFWMKPSVLNEYPTRVRDNSQRYQFEHGKNCLSEWVKRRGMKRLVVTWSGEYEYSMWDSIPNGFHRGDQSDLLMGDHISEPPFYANP